MLELIGTLVLLVFWLWIGCFAVWGALQVIDLLFKAVSFIVVKIFIDRSAAYGTFNVCWDDIKRNN